MIAIPRVRISDYEGRVVVWQEVEDPATRAVLRIPLGAGTSDDEARARASLYVERMAIAVRRAKR